MAEMTLRLVRDGETGAPTLIVSLRREEDALPHEHERQHRGLVERLLGEPLTDEGTCKDLVVERERGKPVVLG